MARSSLTNPLPKLNLSRRQTALFQEIVLVGSQMAAILNQSDTKSPLPNGAAKLSRRWSHLMVRLVKVLL